MKTIIFACVHTTREGWQAIEADATDAQHDEYKAMFDALDQGATALFGPTVDLSWGDCVY